MKITTRQIARAARKIWRHEASDGRMTIRSVLTALRIPFERMCTPHLLKAAPASYYAKVVPARSDHSPTEG